MQSINRFAGHISRGTLHIGRWTWYAVAGVLVVLAVVLTVARIALPALAEKKTELERFISEKSAYPVRIGKLDTYWEGVYPGFRILGLEIFSSADLTRAIRLAEVRVSLRLIPLIWGELKINSLIVVSPRLALERLADGRLQITGFEPVRVQRRDGSGKFLPWLLAQKELIIENGELQWFDHKERRPGIYLSNIKLNLHNVGQRHKIGISARFPSEICRDCSLVLDITGNPITSKSWSGRIFLKAIELNLARLPAIARAALPEGLGGEFNVQMWTRWQNGRLRSAKGDVKVANLKLPLKRLKSFVAVNEARTELSLKKHGKHWEVDLEDLWLGLSGPAWSAGHLRMTHGPSGGTAEVKHVNIDDVAALLSRIDGSGKFFQTLRAIRPGGDVHDLKLRVNGKGRVLDDYSFEAKVEDLHSEPVRKIPGVKGISGHLSAQGRRGTFLLNAKSVMVSVPHVFRAPVEADSVFAHLDWIIKSEYVQLIGKDLRVSGDDGNGTGRMDLRIPYDRSIKPYLDLQATFGEGNGANASRYYPINLLTEKTIAWLDGSIVSGHVTSGSVVYNGNIANFPFRDGNGTFELHMHVRDGVFNYLPGWTPLSNGEADIHFKNGQMLIVHHQGKIGQLNVGQVTVRAEDLRKTGNSIIEVVGTLEGPVSEAFRVLRDSPRTGDQRWRSYLDTGLGVSGRGILNLKLRIPVRTAHAYDMTGEYLVDNGTLRFRVPRLSANGIHGRVAFNKLGTTTGRLTGRFLGGKAIVDIAGPGDGHRRGTLLSGRGTFTSVGLAGLFPWRLMNYLHGHAEWSANMRLPHDVGRLRLEASLNDMTSTLPAPLDRPNGISEKLVLMSERAGLGQRAVTVRVGKRIAARLAFTEQANGWEFARGAIGLGVSEVRLPKALGLYITARAAHVDLDPWLVVFNSGDRTPPDFIRRLTGNFDSLFVFGREFGRLNIDLIRDKRIWTGKLRGDAVAGRIHITENAEAPAAIDLDLEHLTVLEKKPQAQEVARNPRLFPTLTLKAKSFWYQGKVVGELDFRALHGDLGWKIVRLELMRPEMRLFLQGDWLLIGSQQLTELELQFSSSDMGKTLRAFDSPDQMEEGKVEVTAELSWQGSPIDPELMTLDGRVEVSAEDGRFLKIEQGAGRIFGLLDFSSIGKFLSLDFGPLFGKGLPFKTLSGDISIENGDAYTHNLYLTGPAMQISVNGRVGLVAEDFDFAVQVVPSLGTNIGVWGVLGPQVGVVLLALEKLMKKQFGRGTRMTYVVTGSWDDPKINRLGEGTSLPELEETETGGN